MPRLDFLLIPLLAGYIFLSVVYAYKFRQQRRNTTGLIYDSIVFGFILTFIFLLIDQYIFRSEVLINYRTSVGKLFIPISSMVSEPKDLQSFKFGVLVIVGSLVTALTFNLIFNKKFSLNFAINNYGNALERLIWNTLKNKKDEDKLLMVTTKSLKVYVGYITQLNSPKEFGFINIIPNFSGYRKKDTLELVITTSYLKVIKRLIEDKKQSEITKKIGFIIPKNEIISVSRFDSTVFSEFQKVNMTKKPKKNPIGDSESFNIKGTFDGVLKASDPQSKANKKNK